MRQSMLTNEQILFLNDEKETLSHIQLKLAEIDFPKENLAALQKAIMQLDELFLVVVVGEFNAGKSALVNAILGAKVLPEGVTPTTSRVTLVKWGEESSEQIIDEGFSIYTYPLPLLKELNIVDSPGTNAIIRQHERLTDEYVPRSDLVLFTTSADRPLTESERLFLKRILAWGKKVVFVLNKADIFEDDAALQEAKGFILKHAAAVLGDTPELFPVSARLAQRAQTEPDEDQRQQLRAASRLDDLEKYITSTLDDDTRLQLKFQNPLGVADNLIVQAEKINQAQMDDLKDDRQTVDSIDSAITSFERELENELQPRLAEVESILQRLELRGMDFYDTTLRLTNIHHLVRGDRVRAQFEKQVIQDLPQQLEDQVQRLIDWLVEKDLHEWQQIMTYLQRRQAINIEHIVGPGGSSPTSQRRELIDSVGVHAKSIIENYDQNKEASQLSKQVEGAVAQTALFEVGAVSLGALVTTAVLSSALDITGTVAAGTLAIVGFFVIPYKRKRAKENFKEKMSEFRSILLTTLSKEFGKESQNAVKRLKENVTPYTRYVHSEQERMDNTESTLNEMRQDLATLRSRINVVKK
ncbi:MAG: dynamin family protein [Chloroflexi bacterium]|nr:dynamin family protein [Chloroflexota bacterium]